MQLEITRPFWLAALLLALPPVIYFSRRSLVHFARWQAHASLTTRVVLVVLAVVALCGIQVTTAGRGQFVVFVVDRSASITEESQQAATAFVTQATQHAGGHRVAVLPFAAEPDEVTEHGAERPPEKLAPLNPTETDIAAAIATARAAIPQDFVPQLVLLSDGHQTSGDALAAAKAAAAPVSVKLLPGEPSSESRLPVVMPRVLLVEGRPNSTTRLASALKNELIDVDVRPPQDTPQTLAELQNYDLLILANVAADALSPARMAVVQEFVSQRGGGLIAIGGDQSFTAGGYRNNPALEGILPVFSNLNLAMVLVIDKSGSMVAEGRIELAKEASKRAVDLLGPRDLLGVIVFGDKSQWISRMQLCSDEQKKQEIRQHVDGISTSVVNTVLHPAMEEAFAALNKTGADLKHMIVLTDAEDLTAGYYQGAVHAGVHKAADFEALTKKMIAAGITVSTVAVGKGSDVELLQTLAAIGDQVHCYYRDDPTDVPAIFADDIRQRIAAGRMGVIEKTFTPQVVSPDDVPAGFDLRQLPPLSGYVETLPKQEDIQIILATQQDSGYPLLAWWRQGRGLSAAFTSQAEGAWAEQWTQWPGYDHFWGQLARHAMRKDAVKSFLLQTGWKSGRVRVILDALDRQREGEYLNGAEGALDFSGPDGSTGKSPFVQIAPGRYVAAFAASRPGEYRLTATLRRNGRTLHSRPYGLLIRPATPSPTTTSNEDLLRSIAQSTGGRYDPQAAEVFASAKNTVPQTTQLWPYLLTLVVLLFVLDVALKRIDLPRARES